MGYGWLGTFRQGQWRSYRDFILNERRVVTRRVSVIQAELDRIGRIQVGYLRVTDPVSGDVVVTEQRVSFTVTQGSSLSKLIQAYVALGGNPFDISLFLTPDSTYADDDGSEYQTQPYGGVIYPKTGNSEFGTRYDGGHLVVKKYPPSKTGGRRDLQDNTVSGLVSTSRKWVNQTIQHRIHDLEARILKLFDLREQLMRELDDLSMAIGGTVGMIPVLDIDQFDPKHGVASIISSIDGIFYVKDEEGRADLNTVNEEALESYPSLMNDIIGEEDNTAL